MRKRITMYAAIAVVELALIALCCLGCAGPRTLNHLPTTEAEVRQAFPADRVVRVVDKDGTRLVVFLRPRPAAPRGGMMVYEVAQDGTVRCVRTVVSN
jgi:hypothetical protein